MKDRLFGVGVKPFVVLALGMALFSLLVYYYTVQRDFDTHYKQVRAHFFALDRSFTRINFEVMRGMILAYSDQDAISNAVGNMRKRFEALRSDLTIEGTRYKVTREKLAILHQALGEFEGAVDDFLLLNAGIKNSFVYIASLSSESIERFKNDETVYVQMLTMIATISQARQLSDPAFLDGLRPQAEALAKRENLNPAQQKLLTIFLRHVRYILDNYPAYVKAVDAIAGARDEKIITTIETVFLKEAQTDYAKLDRFVVILLVFFLAALGLIIGLLLRARFENARLRRLEEQLRYSLSHDQLTGLSSREQFEKLRDSFDTATLLLLNIDRFKHINDFYGNDTGNAILKEIALLIRQPALQPYQPRYFRLGGDDFGIILHEIDLARGEQMGALLKQAIEAYAFIIGDIEVFITVTVVANNVAPLLENADLAMKYGKEHSSEGVVHFSEAQQLREQFRVNLAMTREVKMALEHGAVLPWFQPIVDLKQRSVVKYEALARLQKADGTVHAPEHFLRIVHQTPYYRRITEVIVEKTFEMMTGNDCRFGLNLSMRDLESDVITRRLFTLFEAAPEKAARLDIELLESMALKNLVAVRTFIAKVKSYGCRVAIDDFGSGYSNFSHIVDLDIDILKIDGSLIVAMLGDAKTLRTVETIVQFAHTLGLEIVAEFIEDAKTADALERMGVDFGQGYFFGRPGADLIAV